MTQSCVSGGRALADRAGGARGLGGADRLATWRTGALVALLLSVLATTLAEAQRTGVVVQVVDATTVQVRLGDAVETVCYIGVAAPEIPHPAKGSGPYREAATEANRRLVEGRRVVLTSDTQERDAQGCQLAYLFVNAQNASAELLHRGFAELATYPPNVQYASYFRSLQHLAFIGRVP